MLRLECSAVIHQSATTLIPLTGDVNNTDLLVIMECSAGKTLGPGIHEDAA